MAHTGAPLTSDNVGWKLLEKAGWRKGHGIGAHEQGPKEPIQPSAVQKGQAGLGFQLKSKTISSKGRTVSSLSSVQLRKEDEPEATEGQLKPLKKKPAVKKPEQNIEVEERKAIARFVYSSFKEEPGEVDNSSQATNPLLRSKKSRLSATNPLL
jgi:hypothetical protein